MIIGTRNLRFTLPIGGFVAIIAIVIGLLGCSPEYYVKDADDEVYQIIDEKWQDEFGPKTNIRISDVEAAPDDIPIDPDELIPSSGILSLRDAVRISTAMNRDYQSRKESLYTSALGLSSNRHNYDPILSGGLGGRYSNNVGTGSERLTAGPDFSIRQALADGANISVGLATTWTRYLTGDPDVSLASALSASITQPLLRGFGRKIELYNLTQAERNMIYALRSFSDFRKTNVVGIIGDYYGVLQSRDQVINATVSRDMFLRSEDMTMMQAEIGQANRFEVDQVRIRKFEVENELIQVQLEYQDGLDRFKINTLGLPIEAQIELDPNELEALKAAGIQEEQYDIDQAIATALTQRLDFLNTQDRLVDDERAVMLAQDNLRITLDLTASTGSINSTPETKFARFQFHEGTYSLDLDSNLFLDRKGMRNSYRQAVIRLTASKRSYEQQVDNIKLQVRQALRNLEQSAFSYNLALEGLKSSQDQVENSEILFQWGLINMESLLRANDDLRRTQNNTTSALVRYTIDKLDFYNVIGVLQVQNDGFWYQDFFDTGEIIDERSEEKNQEKN